ncbi:unnamed protein product [Calypogeia fissa]
MQIQKTWECHSQSTPLCSRGQLMLEDLGLVLLIFRPSTDPESLYSDLGQPLTLSAKTAHNAAVLVLKFLARNIEGLPWKNS